MTTMNLTAVNLDVLHPRSDIWISKYTFSKALDELFELAKKLHVKLEICMNLTHIEMLILQKVNEIFYVNQTQAKQYFTKLEDIKLKMLLNSK
ncbi:MULTISPECIES: hypothetical protein [unclassified Listeria]|uniref:hypothetical protein n=1 Tax=unclassified Listeria TaxID=2642072 RepID=UPI000B5923CE|nr:MULTISPECIES: hypothetical protein [unclassified Listeria]